MTRKFSVSSSRVPRGRFITFLILALIFFATTAARADPGSRRKHTLEGLVKGNGESLPHYEVSLFASFPGRDSFVRLLGSDTTDIDGRFTIQYTQPARPSYRMEPVLYVLAESGNSMLASVIGGFSGARRVVLTELTTVATGTAFAQFINGRAITGNRYGVHNAAAMAANMANPETGEIGAVLDQGPNGGDTSTRATFYAMANIVAGCVARSAGCNDLFAFATPKKVGQPPATVLQALANMTKFPSKITLTNAPGLYALSRAHPVYGPALD